MTVEGRARRALDGLLLLDKPSGITSNRALQQVKRLFMARKAGHTGSLDPLASGMLPLCFGEATKFAGYLLDADKTYLVQLRFGIRTDTGDAQGQPVATGPRAQVPREELAAALTAFIGPQQQVPPMYSALKQEGQRLYTLARAGRVVERPPRPVVIHEFSIKAFAPDLPVLQVRCSKGTYVRSLVEDLATHLGTTAHVNALRRTGVTPFEENRMHTMDTVAEAASRGTDALDALLLPLEATLPDWPSLALDTNQAASLLRGQGLVLESGNAAGMFRLYGPGARFLGIGALAPDGRLVSRRLLATHSDDFPPRAGTGL